MSCIGQDGALCRQMWRKYVPIGGAISHALFGAVYMNPNQFESSILSSDRLLNGLLLGSSVGAASYIYTRKHLAAMVPARRLLFTAYGCTLYSLASVLFLGTARMMVECKAGRVVLALIGTAFFVAVGKEYMDSLDRAAGAV